jgi:hypothetical protein
MWCGDLSRCMVSWALGTSAAETAERARREVEEDSSGRWREGGVVEEKDGWCGRRGGRTLSERGMGWGSAWAMTRFDETRASNGTTGGGDC